MSASILWQLHALCLSDQISFPHTASNLFGLGYTYWWTKEPECQTTANGLLRNTNATLHYTDYINSFEDDESYVECSHIPALQRRPVNLVRKKQYLLTIR